jgi:hypothetical protein
VTCSRAIASCGQGYSSWWSWRRGILTAQAPAKTVWDGAYTDAQAERAQGTFSATCARCHT